MNELDRLSQHQCDALRVYYEMLIDANTRVNLTAITEERDVYVKHFADSLTGADCLFDGARVLDIGCGAGFPSLPLKICNPTLRFTLIDSVNKKINFVQDVIAKLGLSGIEARHCRIEEIAERDYDFVVARAVAKLSTLSEYALPFLKIGGRLVAYKSSDIDEELAQSRRALSMLGGAVAEVRKVRLDEETLRKLVVIEKTRPTPPKYPRPKNLPRTNPL